MDDFDFIHQLYLLPSLWFSSPLLKELPFPSLCQIENFYYLLFASDQSSNLLHDPALFLQSLAVFAFPQCSPFSHVMKCTTFFFLFFFFNKEKTRLSYPWPDLLLWLMTHILLPFLAEIMELVICIHWLALLAGLAASPCPSLEGLLPAPPLTSCSPQHRVNTPLPQTCQLLSTARSSALGFVLLHTSVMTKWGWKGLWQVS